MPALRNKIASMFIMGFDGTEYDPQSDIAQAIRDEQIGGVILFDVNWKTKGHKNILNPIQLRALTESLQQAATYPLLIAVDYEGGRVSRLQPERGFPKTHTAKQITRMEPEVRASHYATMTDTLTEHGFNVDFAPVVDLERNDNLISQAERAYSDDPKEVIKFAREFVHALQDKQIIGCLKHFPGHGSSTGDTHEGLVDVTETWQADELEPYEALLPECDTVMIAHVINRQLDPSGVPATLSKTIMTDLLKDKLGYKGVVISDDMQMGAISKCYEPRESLIQSINAGCDQVIYSNQMAEDVTATQLIDWVEAAVANGEISEARIEDAYQRVQRLRQKQEAALPRVGIVSA